MEDLVIVGAGGFGREVHQIVLDLNSVEKKWNVLGFLDEASAKHGSEVHGLPVLGGIEWLRHQGSVSVVIAIGHPAPKRKMVVSIEAMGSINFATLVHPLAWSGQNVKLGKGVIVAAGVRMTTDIEIGDHVILNLNCTVGHDAIVGDYTTLAPNVNLSGGTIVEEGCDLGTNSVTLPAMRLGRWSVFGAGAIIAKNMPSNVTALGVPAVPVKERTSGWHL